MKATLLQELSPAGEVAAEKTKTVTDWVLGRLGTPSNLFRLETRHLWGHHFRVNVYCWQETSGLVKKVRISDSFHVCWTDDGPTSNPEIERKYGN